jgi:hypothetical protein
MDVLQHVKEIEAKQNGGTDNANNKNAHTTSSSSPRSFWYRLRGWSLVDGTPSATAADFEAPTSTNGSSLSISEIEMETWTSTSPATQSTVAAEEP